MAKMLANAVQLLVDKYDFTLGGKDIRFGFSVDMLESTDLNVQAPTFIKDLRTTTLDYSGLFDTVATGNETGLLALLPGTTEFVVTLFLGKDTNKKAIMSGMKVASYKTATKLKTLLPLQAEFSSDRAPEYGLCLQEKVTKVATFNGDSLDLGAGGSTTLAAEALTGVSTLTVASATGFMAGDTIVLDRGQAEEENVIIASISGAVLTLVAVTTEDHAISDKVELYGGVWGYHVLAWTAAGGNAQWQLVLQESDDDAVSDAWATKDTVNITAIGAARRALTGWFERYTRITATLDASSGSITFAVFVKRSLVH